MEARGACLCGLRLVWRRGRSAAGRSLSFIQQLARIHPKRLREFPDRAKPRVHLAILDLADDVLMQPGIRRKRGLR